jgi:hypothetical protein
VHSLHEMDKMNVQWRSHLSACFISGTAERSPIKFGTGEILRRICGHTREKNKKKMRIDMFIIITLRQIKLRQLNQ